MPQRAAINTLPEDVRRGLEQRLVGGGFAGYVALADWLQEQGFEISKSAVHRYGQVLERRLAAIRASTQAAQLIAESAPDEEDARSAAVLSLVQTDLFNALLDLQEAGEAEEGYPDRRVKLLSHAARAIADVSRASVVNKKWAAEVRAKMADRLNALDAEAGREPGRLDPETLRRVREELYGILP